MGHIYLLAACGAGFFGGISGEELQGSPSTEIQTLDRVVGEDKIRSDIFSFEIVKKNK